MSDIIHLLSDDLANKIAAGEVVVRPAAVVKELLENAIDAGANTLTLIIKDGGKTLIQVVDNGAGMSVTDARMSFERHATSKINTIEDLFSIKTMGFRGEALPSIAAVAKVEMKTRLHDEELGTEIKIEGAEFKEQNACQTTPGTSISVKSLFYNVPARRKFLKSTSVETRHIIEEFTRIALANPEIKLVMYNNDKETFHLPAQPLHKRIAQLFGKKTEERIVPVEEDTDIVKVNGFIGKPEFAKRTKGEQYFFVNNRFIRSPYLNHAVNRAYMDYIESKHYPLYVLFLTIDSEKIDINVHPSKHEVKFEDEQHIYTIVSAAVKHALSKFLVTPQLDFDMDPSFNRHEFFRNPINDTTPIENSTSKPRATFLKRGGQVNQENWEELYQFDKQQEQQIEQVAQQATPELSKPQYQFNQIGQRLIAVSYDGGLFLIDQRRAHQRILYEQLLSAFEEQKFAAQKLLFPETITLNPTLMLSFEEAKEDLQHLGFDVAPFGDDAVIVQATPADLQLTNLQEVLKTLLSEISAASTNKINLREKIAKHLAMVAAIRKGQKLNDHEMATLFQQLQNCEQPNYGIRKDKTVIHYPFTELDRLFQI